ncbi:phosphosulfolactate synthase [Sphingomonas sp. H39-1-10]|uniref:phosphosulfolactate synthase n=1 Tax=Sphingomonas pollutisoli TaxID=3030829 RepID=UPI0023B97BDB|nr:phosphosulfolactate synthase [Sphingomonas pollutisoli]MDF0490058.1 phosphosulfolactate synthase [Sphingomonas pollutisoli]
MPASQLPTFLDLPARSAKPRKTGITHILDKGSTTNDVQAILESAARYIDVWKFGFGTSYVDPTAPAKIALLKAAGIKTCTGGTLLEIAWLRGRAEAFFEFAAERGFDCVEVSDGATDIPFHDKLALIERANALGFEVLSEIGSKDPTKRLTSAEWVSQLETDAQAGARWIVIEGRESGTVGLYDEYGKIRNDILHAVTRSRFVDKLIFEAPQRAQQAFLIREFGPEVNLGNILVDDVISLETLRLGLRADTLQLLADVDREGRRVVHA